MEMISELLAYLKNRKKYWLAPLLILLILIGTLLVVTSGTAIAPFLYTIF